MALKFRHILKVFKLYEGLRIYGYMSAVARIQKISREQKGFKINNFETIGNIERQKNGVRKSLEMVSAIVTFKNLTKYSFISKLIFLIVQYILKWAFFPNFLIYF